MVEAPYVFSKIFWKILNLCKNSKTRIKIRLSGKPECMISYVMRLPWIFWLDRQMDLKSINLYQYFGLIEVKYFIYKILSHNICYRNLWLTHTSIWHTLRRPPQACSLQPFGNAIKKASPYEMVLFHAWLASVSKTCKLGLIGRRFSTQIDSINRTVVVVLVTTNNMNVWRMRSVKITIPISVLLQWSLK